MNKRLLHIIYVLLLPLCLLGQDESSSFEKAYLHFDKPYYAAGDTIYFKAYLVAGSLHRLSQMSRVLYVDCIDPFNKIIHKIKLPLNDGLTWGDFALPDSLSSGNYKIRAYTNMMRTDSSCSFFYKTIPINGLSPIKRDSDVTKSKEKQGLPSFMFFPEGGSLVNGVKSKVAFKAVAVTGLGIEVKGVLFDEDNKEVASFASRHLGMGVFDFRPLRGKNYIAKLFFSDGSEESVALPSAVNSGHNLSIDTVTNDAIFVNVSFRDTTLIEKKDSLYLIAQSGRTIYSAVKLEMGRREFTAKFLKRFFPEGIIQFTLFSAAGEPLNERLFFLSDTDRLKLSLGTNKKKYRTREKVQINLSSEGKQGEPVLGAFSVAVTDETKLPVDDTTESTILTNLLLTTALKGYVENPGYYFSRINKRTATDLDILMLTQGYRSFKWRKILSDKDENKLERKEKGLTIIGTIKKNGTPLSNAKVKLFSKMKGGVMLDTISDFSGRFVFDNLSFMDSTKFVLQGQTAKGNREVDIVLDDEANSPEVGTSTLPFNNQENLIPESYVQSSKLFSEEEKKYGINQHPKMLKEVVIRDKKLDPHLEHSDNLNGKGQADQVLTAKDFDNFPCGTIMDCLQSKLNSVKVQYGKLYSKHSLTPYYDPELKKTTFAPMAVVIDGTRSDYEELHSLTIDDVDAFEVELGTHGGAIYGSFGANGVIIVTTKRAKKQNLYYKEAPGVIVYTAQGFYKAREFYSPQYDNPHTNQKMADLRSTIYWNPDIITDKDGKASFSYFNADGKGTYR
ncbi:MAG TPA: hypothetical protein VHA56_14330, partial [Mucilaginibacter sp.]|nr:hypothetical protein [Mucilaginibacter sp.]